MRTLVIDILIKNSCATKRFLSETRPNLYFNNIFIYIYCAYTRMCIIVTFSFYVFFKCEHSSYFQKIGDNRLIRLLKKKKNFFPFFKFIIQISRVSTHTKYRERFPSYSLQLYIIPLCRGASDDQLSGSLRVRCHIFQTVHSVIVVVFIK